MASGETKTFPAKTGLTLLGIHRKREKKTVNAASPAGMRWSCESVIVCVGTHVCVAVPALCGLAYVCE